MTPPRHWLPNDEARCKPHAKPCTVKGRCLRYLAPAPTHGATSGDFTLRTETYCGKFIDMETQVDMTPPKPKAKPWPSA